MRWVQLNLHYLVARSAKMHLAAISRSETKSKQGFRSAMGTETNLEQEKRDLDPAMGGGWRWRLLLPPPPPSSFFFFFIEWGMFMLCDLLSDLLRLRQSLESSKLSSFLQLLLDLRKEAFEDEPIGPVAS
ncbi:hypothetical protein NL676_030362 [Syzygium grande]|nr:hypothetical protein NL676_030362 [Syzygium grande]